MMGLEVPGVSQICGASMAPYWCHHTQVVSNRGGHTVIVEGSAMDPSSCCTLLPNTAGFSPGFSPSKTCLSPPFSPPQETP